MDNMFKESYLHKIVHILNTFYIPTVIGLGLLGNIIAFAVFVATYLNRLSLSVYMAALAVSDSGFLVGLFISWLEYADMPLFHTNGWCQFVIYITYVCSFLSAWFVVSFTVERYIAICHPLHRPEMCTTRRAKGVVGGLTLFGLLAYAVSLWTSGIKKLHKYEICTALNDYYDIHRALTYVDIVITLIIPFCVIFAFNVIIAHKIGYFYSKTQHPAIPMTATWTNRKGPRVGLGNKAQYQVTKLLLIISTVFLVINMPSYALRLKIFVINFTHKVQHYSQKEAQMQQLFQFLFYLNFAINFFLYSLCSKKFREAISRLSFQIKYKLVNFCARSYQRIRGSSSPDSYLQEMTPRVYVGRPCYKLEGV